MKTVTIDGQRYEVADNLGYQIGTDKYVVEVSTNKGLKMAVSHNKRGPYRFYTTEERIAPLKYALLKKAQEKP